MDMQPAIDVFINGIAGVFAGIAVLYVVIHLNSAIAGREIDKPEK